MKWLRVLTILLVLLIVGSATVLIVLTSTYSKNEGSVEGTGFIIQELYGVGGISYDVDDEGNIYFAVTSPRNNGIVIYNNNGHYMYTLPIQTMGALGVRIDEYNNILVYVIRKDLVFQYDNKGRETKTIDDSNYSLRKDFFWPDNKNVRERNGIRYINSNGTITKEDNGVETIVFRVPVWQRWYSAFKLTLIFSCIGLFLRLFIPKWVKSYRDVYGKV